MFFENKEPPENGGWWKLLIKSYTPQVRHRSLTVISNRVEFHIFTITNLGQGILQLNVKADSNGVSIIAVHRLSPNCHFAVFSKLERLGNSLRRLILAFPCFGYTPFSPACLYAFLFDAYITHDKFGRVNVPVIVSTPIPRSPLRR